MLMILAILPNGSALVGVIQTVPPVPAEYQQLYSILKTSLDSFNSQLDTRSAGANYSVIYGAELLPANSNRGEALLTPNTMQGVKLYLDRFQELGINGVTFPVGYPLYTPSFPRYQEYVQFYKQVVQEIRSRGMTIDIETSVLFTNTAFSTLTFNYGAVSFQEFENQRRQMVAALIQDLQPDYLNLGAEPDTQYKLTGYAEFNSPDQYAAYINYLLNGLDRGKAKVGAGIGTWGNVQYVQSLAANTGLDYIAIHVYPTVGSTMPEILRIADVAHQHGKGVTLDEAWLYKVDTLQSTSIAANVDIFRRDLFSFWAPLDQEFLATIVRTARLANILYISPFWSMLFFSYVDYDSTTAALSYSDLSALVNKVAAQNIANDQFSSTGSFYQDLIRTQSHVASTSSTSITQLTLTTSTEETAPKLSVLVLIALAAVVSVAAIAAALMSRRRQTK
jgi:hypothetical protein